MIAFRNLTLKRTPKTSIFKSFKNPYIFYNFSQSTRNPINHYQTLGISPEASFDQIKKKFRQLSKVYHPDYYKGKGEQQKFHQIQKAYKILSQLKTRKQHDLSLGISKSAWESQEYKLESDKFESEVFEEVLKDTERKRSHEVKSLDQKVYLKFEKQIETPLSQKQKAKGLFLPIIGFSIFWVAWNIFESIIINYQGDEVKYVQSIKGEKRLSAIPIKLG